MIPQIVVTKNSMREHGEDPWQDNHVGRYESSMGQGDMKRFDISRAGALLLLFFSVESFSIELIAHRANCCGQIENSLLAITKAWEAGADAVEVDLRISSDGIIYLFHDAALNGVDVSSYTYSEIAEIENSVTTLSTVLGVGAPSGYYILDLKENSVKFLESLTETILNSNFPVKKIAFQSINIETLKAVKRMLPGAAYILVSKLRRNFPWFIPPLSSNLAAVLQRNKIDHISIKGRKFIDKGFVNNLKAKGIRVFVWTVNDLERAEYYDDIGVDGIITDDILGLRAMQPQQASR